MRLFVFHCHGDFSQLLFCQPCPDTDAPFGSGIAEGQIVRHEPDVPRGVQALLFFGEDFLRIGERLPNIGDAAGGNGKDVRVADDIQSLHECLHLQGKSHVVERKYKADDIGSNVRVVACLFFRDGAKLGIAHRGLQESCDIEGVPCRGKVIDD